VVVEYDTVLGLNERRGAATRRLWAPFVRERIAHAGL
jgi:hypothetical protein